MFPFFESEGRGFNSLRARCNSLEPELKEKGLVYVYADLTLEQLSPAQKHLLRMGPANARAIQGWLKKLEEAIPKPPP